ncbi:unnamed protein product [Closterium sp. NIES-53]
MALRLSMSTLVLPLFHCEFPCRLLRRPLFLTFRTLGLICLIAESESDCLPFVRGECALGTDVLEDRQEDFECLAAAVPHLVAMLLAPDGDPDALDIPTSRTYAEAITGSLRLRGFSQQQGVDFFQTFSPTPKMTTLWVLLHVAAQGDYELHSLEFGKAFLQGRLHEEIWLRRPRGFTGSFPEGTQWSLTRPVYGLRQAPREWHDILRTTLAALGFAPSTADPSLFLRTDTSLPPFYILVYVNDLVFATADTKALALVKSELQKRQTCTDLGPSALRLLVLLVTVHSSAYRSLALSSTFGRVPSWHATLRPEEGARAEHWEAAKRVLRYLCSTSGMGLVPGGRGLVVLTRHADASWELRWLTYLLTDLGERPRSPPVLYQRGQLCLAYETTRANTADIFTKALQSGDHQRFCTVLGLVPALSHLLTA